MFGSWVDDASDGLAGEWLASFAFLPRAMQ